MTSGKSSASIFNDEWLERRCFCCPKCFALSEEYIFERSKSGHLLFCSCGWFGVFNWEVENISLSDGSKISALDIFEMIDDE
jgi:hypothetical protein